MYGYIYKTTNLINGKIYIGKHKVKNNKFDESYYGSGIHLKNAINFYGKQNFIVEVVEWCETPEMLNEKEIFYIKEFSSTDADIGYNLQLGGVGGWEYINSRPELINRHFTPLSGSDNPNYGNIYSEETRNKIRMSIKLRGGHKGENNPMFGRKHSEEAKNKIGAKLKDRHPSLEARLKMSKSRTGLKRSEETKQKMSMNNAMKNPIYRKKVSEALKVSLVRLREPFGYITLIHIKQK